MIKRGVGIMGKWNYEDLDDDVEELTRNLLEMNQQSLKKAEKSMYNLKLEKSEKRLHNTRDSTIV